MRKLEKEKMYGMEINVERNEIRKDEPYLSIIVVYNDKTKFNNIFLDTLNEQTFENYELIAVNNMTGRFTSAQKAYSYGGNQSRGKYLMFCHQDIKFNNPRAIEDAIEYVESGLDREYGVLGLAGADAGKNGNVEYVSCKQNTLPIIKECFTLDECLFVTSKELYDKLQFTYIGETWHLYAVEFCLHCKKVGYKVGCFPIDATHLSGGNRNRNFFKSMRKVLHLYGSEFSRIYTTCIDIKTVQPMAEIYLIISQYTPLWIKKIWRIVKSVF